MHRTGVAPNGSAIKLYRLIANSPGLRPGGLQAYDGHIHDKDVAVRELNCETAFEPVSQLVAELSEQGLAVPTIVAGGTPTFPFHARRPLSPSPPLGQPGTQIECSPGTCVLWDYSYATKCPEMEFLFAA